MFGNIAIVIAAVVVVVVIVPSLRINEEPPNGLVDEAANEPIRCGMRMHACIE